MVIFSAAEDLRKAGNPRFFPTRQRSWGPDEQRPQFTE